jgi:ribA/ribD-fused uncharacterized protein
MPHSLAEDGAPLSVAALLHKMKAGWAPEFLFFWGHKAKATNAVGKHVFSQWWPAAFEVDGVRYPTAEHYMMAEKARLFADNERLALILEAESPDRAKALGRKVQNFNAARWEAVAVQCVIAGNLAKFSQNPALKAYLLATGQKVIVEASPLDRIWGIGMAASGSSLTIRTPRFFVGGSN